MGNRSWYLGMLFVTASAVLTACGGGEERPATAPLPAEPPVQTPPPAQPPTQPPAQPAANSAPTISGAPSASATPGVAWQFQPAAQDADGDALTFSATGLPAWATISPQTGLVSGVPGATSAGTTAGIVITVSDGRASASLPAFSITVAQPASKGTAVLRWSAPTQYTDGMALSTGDLVAFHIYYGRSSTTLQRVAEVDAQATSFTVKELDAGTHYFAVTAVSAAGTESTFSTVGSKTIS